MHRDGAIIFGDLLGKLGVLRVECGRAGRYSVHQLIEQAQAFFNSTAWKDLAPQRDKAVNTIRRYAVEAMN